MTVSGVTEDGYVTCTWFDAAGEVVDYDFEPEMLTPDDVVEDTDEVDEVGDDAFYAEQVAALYGWGGGGGS